MRNYFRHGGRAEPVSWNTARACARPLDEYCPLPWTQLRCERVGLMLNANALVGA